MLENTFKSKIPNIGDRIECTGDLGTIKYIGPVDGYSSTWFGIDWDDANRGKHDGSLNGKRYFIATYPKSGSFVRPEKVRLGQNAVTAITSRYGRHDDELTAKYNEQQLLSIQQSINAPFLKLVGFDKITNRQSDFYNLKVVNLRLQNIFTSGEKNALGELCPNITELDISRNLIVSWEVIFDICSQLKLLTWLNVSENNLVLPDEIHAFHYPNVEVLICGSANLPWSNVVKLSCVFPNLKELRVPNNKIIDLETPIDNNFTNLKILDLESNQIENWDEVLKLKVMPKIEQLNLENNGLKFIKFNGTIKSDEFTHLTKLILSNNLINDWESVGELNKLQKLEELKFLKNPVLDTEDINTVSQLIIGKIGNLKYLNGSFISPDERKSAEYFYVKKYGLEYLAVRSTDKEKIFLEKYNRYEELIKEQGVPEESELTVQPKILKVSLLDLDIVYLDKSVRKKLPPSILIQKLIMLVQRLFNLKDRPLLVYSSSTKPEIEITLDDECKELSYYSMQNGDKILVKT